MVFQQQGRDSSKSVGFIVVTPHPKPMYTQTRMGRSIRLMATKRHFRRTLGHHIVTHRAKELSVLSVCVLSHAECHA